MSVAQYERYAIHTDVGDPLPRVGSGLRLVEAKLGHKWVKIRIPGEQATRIRRNVWDTEIAHVLYHKDTPMSEITAELRNFGRRPRKA